MTLKQQNRFRIARPVWVSKLASGLGLVARTFIWVGLLGVFIPAGQLAALEICARAGIFPLYGFFAASVLDGVVLIGIYRLSAGRRLLPVIRFPGGFAGNAFREFAGHIPFLKIKPNPPIPALLLIITYKKTPRRDGTVSTARNNQEFNHEKSHKISNIL